MKIIPLLAAACLGNMLGLVQAETLNETPLNLQLSIPMIGPGTDLGRKAHPASAMRIKESSPCTAISTLYFSHSSHPDRNRFGQHNENNGGYGGKCHLDEDQYFYIIMAGLTNSKGRPTFVFGPGYRFPLRMGRVEISYGHELVLMHYELNGNGAALYGVLPMQVVGVSFELPRNWGMLGMEQRTLLGTGGVKVYATQLTIRKSF